jgi:hypothetical protein
MSSDDFSEKFTKGRYDSSETLVQGHHHTKKHHAGTKHHAQHLVSKDAAQEEKEMEQTFADEEAAAAAKEAAEAAAKLDAKLKKEYAERFSQANEYDGSVHKAGQRFHVDDGTAVGGVNLYAQNHQGHMKHPAQHHHKMHKKTHHKKHMIHKPHAVHKHELPESFDHELHGEVAHQPAANLAQVHHKGAVK